LSNPDRFNPSWLKVGKVTSTHGLKGEVKVYPEVDDPRLFSGFKKVYLVNPKRSDCLDIERVGYHKSMVILKLSGIDDINAAQAIRNSELMLPREDIMELSDDQYFEADLIGLEAVTEDGRALGSLTEVIHTGANDVYAVRDDSGKEYLIPAIKSCIREIDLTEHRIVIVPMDGLIT
jgi:16S rRNA processing protein RimM